MPGTSGGCPAATRAPPAANAISRLPAIVAGAAARSVAQNGTRRSVQAAGTAPAAAQAAHPAATHAPAPSACTARITGRAASTAANATSPRRRRKGRPSRIHSSRSGLRRTTSWNTAVSGMPSRR